MPLTEPVPDIRSLDLLRTVAELGSIRQAASAHHISQPAASMRLRSLERTLDLELLDRSTGRARLTVTGLAVVQWSEAVLESMRDLLLGTAAVRSEGRDSLRIAASMTVAEYLVPGWLNRLRGSDPDVTIALEMGNSEHVSEVILAGGADIGFVEGPDDPSDLQPASCRVTTSWSWWRRHTRGHADADHCPPPTSRPRLSYSAKRDQAHGRCSTAPSASPGSGPHPSSSWLRRRPSRPPSRREPDLACSADWPSNRRSPMGAW